MRHLVKLVYLLFFCAFTSGCEKSTTKDEYYIKYQVESSTIYYGAKLNVQINNVNGSLPFEINQRENWETIIGPVNKGFKASLKATKQGWDGQTEEYHLRINIQIQVSKNNGPFAMKQINASNTPRAIAETNYIIE